MTENQYPPALINSSTTLEEGIRTVLNLRIEQLAVLLDKKNWIDGVSAKLVHKTRVACRRLIVAARLFKRVSSKRLFNKLQSRAEEVLENLGTLRNWDSYANALENHRGISNPAQKTFFLDGIAWANRQRFEKIAMKFFKAKADKLTSFLLKAKLKIHQFKNNTTSPSFLEWSRLGIMTNYDDINAEMETLEDSEHAMHSFRLKVKFLRYGMEIMGDAIQPEKAAKFLKFLKNGQSYLGMINDLHFQIKTTSKIKFALELHKKDFEFFQGESEFLFLEDCRQRLESTMSLYKAWKLAWKSNNPME